MDPILLDDSALALAELTSLDRKALAKRWQAVFGCPAPRRAQAPLLRSALGTRLLREWQGQTYHVSVAADGFEYGGKTYRSLTAISREITGTAWSGPLFFGLRK
jgi:hypothetical protein